MIGIEDLDALDLTIWLGRGSAAARVLGCNQSTVSRRSGHCLNVFGLNLGRDEEGWPRTSANDLLQLEREVHQLQRLRQGKGLRLDASLLAAPLLQGGTPAGWIHGSLDSLGWQRPLQLLNERILDAWITAMGQEIKATSPAGMLCVPLLITPLQLAAAADHPLLGQGTLRPCDLAGMPRLAPRAGAYPRTEQLLGPWREQQPALTLASGPRQRSAESDGTAPDLALHYGTRFSLAHQNLLTPLPLELSVPTQLCLLMRRDISDQAAMLQLLHHLQKRAAQAARADLGMPCPN